MTPETQRCDNVVTTLYEVATKIQTKPNVVTTSCASWDFTGQTHTGGLLNKVSFSLLDVSFLTMFRIIQSNLCYDYFPNK